jgi:hypothetical protein
MLEYARCQSEASLEYEAVLHFPLSGKTFSLIVKRLDRRPIDPPPILRMSLDTLDPDEEQYVL